MGSESRTHTGVRIDMAETAPFRHELSATELDIYIRGLKAIEDSKLADAKQTELAGILGSAALSLLERWRAKTMVSKAEKTRAVESAHRNEEAAGKAALGLGDPALLELLPLEVQGVVQAGIFAVDEGVGIDTTNLRPHQHDPDRIQYAQ